MTLYRGDGSSGATYMPSASVDALAGTTSKTPTRAPPKVTRSLVEVVAEVLAGGHEPVALRHAPADTAASRSSSCSPSGVEPQQLDEPVDRMVRSTVSASSGVTGGPACRARSRASVGALVPPLHAVSSTPASTTVPSDVGSDTAPSKLPSGAVERLGRHGTGMAHPLSGGMPRGAGCHRRPSRWGGPRSRRPLRAVEMVAEDGVAGRHRTGGQL